MLYPHTARDDDELTLSVNDEVTVIEKGRSGWWRGRLGDKEGLFPSSFVMIHHKGAYPSVSSNYMACRQVIRTDWLVEGLLQILKLKEGIRNYSLRVVEQGDKRRVGGSSFSQPTAVTEAIS